MDLCYGNSQKLLILRERLREIEEYKNRESDTKTKRLMVIEKCRLRDVRHEFRTPSFSLAVPTD